MIEELIKLRLELIDDKNKLSEQEYHKKELYYLKLGRIYFNSLTMPLYVLDELVDKNYIMYPNVPIEFAPMLVSKVSFDAEYPYMYLPAQAYVCSKNEVYELDGNKREYSNVYFIYNTFDIDKIDLVDWYTNYDNCANPEFKETRKVDITDTDIKKVQSWCDSENSKLLLELYIASANMGKFEKKEYYLKMRDSLMSKMVDLQYSIPEESSLGLKLRKNNVLIKR